MITTTDIHNTILPVASDSVSQVLLISKYFHGFVFFFNWQKTNKVLFAEMRSTVTHIPDSPTQLLYCFSPDCVTEQLSP